MDESRLREALDRLAQRADVPDTGAERVIGKGRARAAMTLLAGASSILLLVGGVVFLTQDRTEIPQPADPRPSVVSPTPTESPTLAEIDGRIAFLSEKGRGCCFRLFVTEGFGDVRKVNNVFGYGSRLDWSPDGRFILVDRGLSEGNGALVVIDAESGRERVLFSDQGSRRPINPQSPSWSPDGEDIAFSTGSGDIYVMDLDDKEPLLVATSPRICGYSHPSWSPDGNTLAFSNGCPGPGGITVVPADGGPPDGASQRRLTDKRRDLEPSWSPDGSKIAFTRFGPEGNQIMVLDLESGTETVLTEDADSYRASWSPDGSQIVFGSNRTGDQNIWVMNADGSNEVPLTTGRETSIAPAWGPK